MSRTNRLLDSNAALTEAAEEINSGVIGADEIYGTIHGLGCDWETLMVVHVDEVSLSEVGMLLPLWYEPSCQSPRCHLLIAIALSLTYSYTILTSLRDPSHTPKKRTYQSLTSFVQPENLSIPPLTHGLKFVVQK